ncbi:hypothetical protein PF001_g445 [Phytophthora fragariae]|uniref:Uncharacterized protein n=1 Tax=Phytophthora fragariae TaxID=53985 RepID=A0A6A4EVN3_9STRA|nr:hypothetical protein PF001_g445 [Phytophthora fragariae]
MKDTGVEDLHTLQEELKRLGISVVSGRQDTVISVKIKGLAGRALLRGLRLADQLLQEKIKNALQTCTDPATKLFTDPTFGPSSSDPDGAAAICRAGGVISAKGGSQHQAKVLGLLQRGKIRWERPIYATENEESDSSPQDEEDDDIYSMTSTDHVFASNATLFADGVSSGDVIQGNLGDCWFLSALSVVATRSDLLEQTFWRRDQHKAKGLFVCKFMKNFVWNYVLIDDRLPVFGFTDKKAGKPYFARCRNPNELWVSLLEKAYAKLHGSYEALIGGFVDCALNDLTGMCSEQVILKEGFPGFGENPYIPAKPQQKHGDPFWEKLARYKQSGTLMGCSIQPPVTAKEVAVESSAGNGLYFKHAYALVDVAEIKTAKGESVRLVKLRNPWGMGEWTGPWSDSSEERAQNEDAIERFFKILKRKVGANAEKRVFMTINAQGKVGADEISQEEVTKINTNDGTFFMSYDAWMQSFTHFFAGIDFPDAWHGRRSEGSWNEANCGGNTTKSTWINNPHFELVIDQRARIFASLSQEDPRGSENLKIVPVGFHICSLSPIGNDPNKVEIREPSKKLDAYYRLYKPADRDSFQTGKRPEHLPPAIIPGTVIPSIDDDGVPQPAYTFKQAVSVEATMEPGRYCIIPSMYMRTDKATGNTNVGNFWLSVYSDKPSFRLEGGEKIVEEEEGDEENLSTGEGSRGNPSIVPAPLDRRVSTASSSKKSEKITATGNAFAAERRRKYENEKEELLRQAKRYGIGLRDLRAEFAKTPKIQKADCRHKLQKLGFSVASWDDEKIGLLFGEEDGLATGVVHTDKILKLFTPDIQEEKMACELPDMEEDGSLNPLEFEKMLERLRIEPALTQGQKTFLVDQFDANGDGEISMTEFKHWILQDRVWEEPPPVLSTARENKALIASEVFDTVIAPLCNEIIDRAFDAYMFSLTVGSWSRSTNSTTEAQTPQSPLAAETGDIVFQRVVSLNIAVGAPTNAVEKVFEQVDGDGSGNIDQFEFIELLSALGMHLNFDDATLLMNRLGAISMGGRITIERSAFLSYAEQMTTKSTDGRHCTSLRDIVIRVDALAGTEANAREIVQCELQQLHEKISHKELLTICKALDEKAAIAIAVDDLRSLAMNLSFDYAASSPTQQVGESADQLDNIKSSGDIVARMLLQEPSGLMKHLLEFDVASFCASSLLVRYEVVGRHTNVETSWQEFQDFIAGQQNVYAVMELHPQERWKRRLEQARQEQFAAEEQHAARLAALQDEIRHLAEENEKQKNAPREASNLKDCRLSAASAHDILSAMRGILTSRCHARPYNGLKKALAAEAEIPGKVTFAVFNDVLGDFGLALSLDHRSTLSSILDPEMIGRINIEDFFIKLCGDAEAYEQVRTSRPQSPAPERSPSPAENPEPIVFTPYPPPVQRPVSPVASPIRASGTKSKMSWQDMKKFLVLNLPEGWETRFTEKGRPYFCNHDNRSTQWKHPRPEIETIFSEWVQENEAYFNRKSTSARVSKQKH